MEFLTIRDVQALQESICEIYVLTFPEGFPDRVLSAVSKLVPCQLATYDEIDLKESRLINAGWPPGAKAAVKDLPAFENYMHEHPFIHLLEPKKMQPHPFGRQLKQASQNRRILPGEAMLGQALKFSDVLLQSQYRSTGLYNEFYRKYDIEYQMVMPLFYAGDKVAGITLNRKLMDFSEKERLLLRLLHQHLVQAHRNAARLSSAGDGRELPEKTVYIASDYCFAGGVQMNFGEHLIEAFGLTCREAEVLFWVSEGKSNADIAAVCSVAVSTVKKHLERIYKKLNVENRTAAAKAALSVKP